MAPPNTQKRTKGVQIFRPFMYGTTAKLFDPTTNPKPEGTPVDHTHSWSVFVKGVDDTDITYWLRKVQFKLHESIPNPMRTVENVKPGEAFEVQETGWGEFEITIKLYYIPESLEKPQTLYHHLRLHPYGETDEAKEAMRQQPEIISWVYEEQVFNEPYEQMYDILTNPMPPPAKGKGGAGKGTRKLAGGMVGSIGERTALLPSTNRPGQPFSKETERLEIKRLQEANAKVAEISKTMLDELKEKEAELAALRPS